MEQHPIQMDGFLMMKEVGYTRTNQSILTFMIIPLKAGCTFRLVAILLDIIIITQRNGYLSIQSKQTNRNVSLWLQKNLLFFGLL